ncbi:hypothetical protein LJC60_00635 [Ruminococcaceae bacterium OttesenSCG-928-D13]|nr:hypothetical protein [Ruminococcaceae bacterium OttesenSCG-928-D13]
MAIAGKMKLRKQQVLKVVTGIVLVLMASFVTIFVRDSLNMRNPENALPNMTIYFDSNGKRVAMPYIHSSRRNYTWQFSLWEPVSKADFDLEPWRELYPGQVNPGSKLELEFSFKPKAVAIYAAAGESSYMEVGDSTVLYAPTSKGNYAYKVVATWGANRTVTYYFRIDVPW